MKRRYAIAGFIVSLALLVWIARDVDWVQVRGAFAQVRLEWVGLIGAIVVFRLLIHSWRWTYLLRPLHPLGLGLCFRATGVGFLSNMLLPSQAGAVVRAAMAGEAGRVPTSSVLATVVMERLIGTLMLLPLMLLALLWVKPPLLSSAVETSLRVGVGFSVAGVAAVGLILFGLVRAGERTTAALGRARLVLPAAWVERLTGWVDAFVEGLRGLDTRGILVPFAALSVAMWGCWFAGNLCLFKAFGLALPPSAALMLMLLQFLSFTLPSGPGVLGAYHVAATTGGLVLYGLPSALALSAAVVFRVAITGVVVLVGLGCWLAESALSGRRLRIREIARPAPGLGRETARGSSPSLRLSNQIES